MAKRDLSAHWLPAYLATLSDESTALAGYYNRNYVVLSAGQKVLVRIPVLGSPAMDVRVLPEAIVMEVAKQAGLPVPRVLGTCTDPCFAVHEFIEAEPLDEVCPRGKSLPPHIIEAIAQAQASLLGADMTAFELYLKGWPRSGESQAFYLRLLDEIDIVYWRHWRSHGWLFEALNIPADPLERLRLFAAELHPRSFGLLHGDLHRKNMLISGSQLWIIDWELALFGDPAYEIAVHLHKMGYQPDEERAYMLEVERRFPREYQEGLLGDTLVYRQLERAKSVIVDIVRYREQLLDERTSRSVAGKLVQTLEQKLLWVQPLWGNLAPEKGALRKILLSRG